METKITGIAWIAPHSSWGGSQEYIKLIAEKSEISQRKFIFCCSAHVEKYESATRGVFSLSKDAINNYDAPSFFRRLLGALSIALQVRAVVKNGQLSNVEKLLIHSNGSPLLCFFLSVLLPSKVCSFVTTFHDFGSLSKNKLRIAFNGILFLAAFIASGRKPIEIIFPSAHIHSQFCTDVSPKWKFMNMSVINTGIVMAHENAHEKTSLEARYRYGMIGRVAEAKAPFTWIEGVACYLQGGGNGTFCWIGDGPLLEECRAHVRDLGLHDRVFFPGYVDDLLSDTCSFGTLVFSSVWEGGCLPRGISEQLVLGKSAILPSLPSIRESFERAGCLHLVDFYSADDSASLALAIMQHEKRPNSSTADIKAFIAKYHSFTTELSKTEAIYSKVY